MQEKVYFLNKEKIPINYYTFINNKQIYYLLINTFVFDKKEFNFMSLLTILSSFITNEIY